MRKLSRRNPDHAISVQLFVGRGQVRVGNKILKLYFKKCIIINITQSIFPNRLTMVKRGFKYCMTSFVDDPQDDSWSTLSSWRNIYHIWFLRFIWLIFSNHKSLKLIGSRCDVICGVPDRFRHRPLPIGSPSTPTCVLATFLRRRTCW